MSKPIELSYDLNLFYADDNDTYMRIQPSIYAVYADDSTKYFYLRGFSLTEAETKIFNVFFPEEEYGTDYFITLPHFYKTAEVIPQRVASLLRLLPNPELVELTDKEISWL